MASGSRRFGVRFAPNRAWRAPYRGPFLGGGKWRKKGRGKEWARGRNRARREERAGEQGKNRKPHLARANAFARAAGRSCCRQGSASPSPVPHPREEQPPAGCCFPVASSGPPLSRTRAASPLPSLFPTRARSSRRWTAVSPPPPLVNIEQEQDPSRLLQSSLEQGQDPSRRLQSSLEQEQEQDPSCLLQSSLEPGTLLLLCIFLASSVFSRAGQQHADLFIFALLGARCSVLTAQCLLLSLFWSVFSVN